MELPECPVCLQVYNSDDTVPRVLSCGHSACEACLKQLPLRFSNTVRCSACTQLVKYPEFQGPSALPKNIDLLSFINSQNPKINNPSESDNQTQTRVSRSRVDAPDRCQFIPRSLWSEEFYSNWNHWILPVDSVSVVERGEESLHCCALRGKVVSSSSASSSTRCFPEENQLVSLVRVGYSSEPDSTFKLSYNARVMEALNRLKEREREELELIFRASLRQRRMCKVYGLWMNSEDGCVFLVSEKFNGDISKRLSSSMIGFVGVNSDGLAEPEGLDLDANGKITAFAMVGIELCEALMSLHSEGLVSGCLAFSCFSFDDFGHIYLDTNEILVMGRRVRSFISEASRAKGDDREIEELFAGLSDIQSFASPELLFELLNYERVTPKSANSEYLIGYGSDIWSLACILVRLLIGERSVEELFKGFYIIFPKVSEESCAGYLNLYSGWMEKVASVMDKCLGPKFLSLQQILCRCLNLDPAHRPHATEVQRCVRELLIEPHSDAMATLDGTIVRKNLVHCFILGEVCHLHKETVKESKDQERDGFLSSEGSNGADVDKVGHENVGRDLINGLGMGSFNSINLQAHLDCVTKLAVGGGFLFSSSYDKTVNVWSLQDFSHLQSLKGHEHRVMALVFVDSDKPLCVSADVGGGIFVWSIGVSVDQKSLRTWYQPKDWRYSGIHALAISGTEQLYTGSGDKSIKAWSLVDYTLTCTMTGHKSTVSSLEVRAGVLYSGSWDGTIRLWSLNDHSPLTVLGDDVQGELIPILSLSVDRDMLVASYENGCVKIWKDDVIVRSSQIHSGAIFSLSMDGKWLFMGGWDKIIDVQELSGDELQIDTRSVGSITCDSVVTALLSWQGKLFAGFADGLIKVYYFN